MSIKNLHVIYIIYYTVHDVKGVICAWGHLVVKACKYSCGQERVVASRWQQSIETTATRTEEAHADELWSLL